jgi:hypothetical protein
MFLRVETGFKAEFSDPLAQKLFQKVNEIHPALGEKIRWVRKLKVYWLELNAPRDKVVQAVQIAFKNSVTDWLFTGDLLPSAAGSTGTLYDLMQESPFRPGVFHGIEKRKRLQVHDEEGFVILDALQVILGRKSPQDRVVSGELLLVEGVRLSQSDLEWLARNWFTHEKFESWSLLSEEELKRNSRFQSEQVAKYLISAQTQTKSRLLQFRQTARSAVAGQDWAKVEEKFRVPIEKKSKCGLLSDEEWEMRPEIHFGSSEILNDTQTEVEFMLLKQQLEASVSEHPTRLQTVLSVLPDPHRLWLSDVHGEHPIRVREEFELSLKRIAETTGVPIVQMKCFEDPHETEPCFFWSASVGLDDEKNRQRKKNDRVEGNLVDLIWIGFSDAPAYTNLTYVELLKSAFQQCQKGDAVEFAFSSTGKTLTQALKEADRTLHYGFDLVLDGHLDWFRQAIDQPLSLSEIWGVPSDKRDWVIQELKVRNLPHLHFGTTTLTGDIRVLEGGESRVQVNVVDFFKQVEKNENNTLLDEAFFVSEKRNQPVRFKNRYSTEELLLKPEAYHVNVASPVVFRPRLSSWGGLMVLSDLCSVEFNADYLEYVMRKCTALGGQIHSIQLSMVNGLKDWMQTIQDFRSSFGIEISQVEIKNEPKIQSHWLALQVVSKVNDVRTVRSEDFKFVNDRIYWLPGNLEQAATRWLAGVEGRHQNGLHNAVAIEATETRDGVVNTLVYALLKRKLGAEVRINHSFSGGFFVSLNENERFTIEEEWKAMGVSYEFVGRVTASPFLVIRNESDQSQTIAIEDLV